MPALNPSEAGPVIVVGAGLSGLATAIGLAHRGRRVIVLEAADLVGGAAAFSGGQVWIGANHVARREGIEDDLASTELYVRGIAHHDPELLDEKAMERWITTAPLAAEFFEDVEAIRWQVIPGLTDYHSEAQGAHGVGRYLTNVPIDGTELGDWRDRLRVSPHFPVGTTYERVMEVGRRTAELNQDYGDKDPLTFGTGVIASFLRRAISDPLIEILTGHRVTDLRRDDAGRVIGTTAEGPDGAVDHDGPVVLATSTYDWDPAMASEYLGIDPEHFGSVAPTSLRGDGITLATRVGAAVGRIPGNRVPMLPGWASDGDPGYTYGPEYALPHCITVDGKGQRFCDDSYWVSFIERALAPGDQHLPCYLVWDDRHRERYGLGKTPPGGDYPEGQVTSAATVAELAEQLGIDPAGLEAQVDRFNEHADEGEDPEWGRGSVPFVRKYAGDPSHGPNPLLGSLRQAPFHGMKIKIVGTGIGSTGILIDGEGHALTESGEIIEGLHAVGAAAALLSSGSGYNSGFSLGRGITLGYLVAHELTGGPVPVQPPATPRAEVG